MFNKRLALIISVIVLCFAAPALAFQQTNFTPSGKVDTTGSTYVSTQDRTSTISLTSTTCPGTGCASIAVEGRTGISFVLTGTWTATVVFEGSIDGTNFISLSAFDDANDKWVSQSTATGSFWVEPLGGMNSYRVRVSAYTSGTVTGTLLGSSAVNQNLETMAGAGSPVPPLVAITGASDGTNIFPIKGSSAANLSNAVNNGTQLSERGARWSITNSGTAASGVQGTISKAAGGAGVRHVIDCIGWSADSAAAIAAANVLLNVRDGATGAGTVVWFHALSFPTAAALGIQEVPVAQICGLNIIGTANTAATIEFSAAVTGSIQAVNMTGYDVN